MAEKDITARDLVHHADVFADIVNGSIFVLTGKWPSPLVQPEDLVDAPTRSVSISGDEIHGQERDVVKFWTAGETVLCLMGLENQTRVDPDMAFRVFSYEGADYRRQLAERDAEVKDRRKVRRQGKRKKPYPVLTIVLYFGTKRPWPKNKLALLDLFPDLGEPLRSLLNNCRVNVIELARLTAEQAAVFKSDFSIVVDYLRQTCQDKEFVPSDQMIVHVEETVRFLSALTGDRGLVENLPNFKQRGVPMTVRNFFGEAREEGIQIGEARGEARGIQIGEARGETRGIQIGEARGRVNMLISLVSDGSLPLAVAAKKANMSEDEFKTRICEQEEAGKS